MKSKNNPSALETLETLESLDTVVNGNRSFAEREAGIERARQLKDSNFRQGLEEQQGLIEKECTERVAQLRQAKEEQVDEIREVFERRRLRIDKAQIEVRNQVIAGIQQSEGARKSQLQRDYMAAGRERDEGLAALASEHERSGAESATIQSRFIKLEKASVKSLRGFGSARSTLVSALKGAEGEGAGSASPEELLQRLGDLSSRLKAFRGKPLVALFNGLPLVVQVFLFPLLGGAIPFGSSALGGPEVPWIPCLAGGGLAAALSVILYFAGKSQAGSFVAGFTEDLSRAKRDRLGFKQAVETRFEEENRAIQARFDQKKAAFERGLRSAGEEPTPSAKYASPDDVEGRAVRLRDRLDGAMQRRIDSAESQFSAEVEEAEADRDKRIADLTGDQTATREGMIGELERQFASLAEQWQASVLPAHERLVEETNDRENSDAALQGDPENWSPPGEFYPLARFGELSYSAEEQEGPRPRSEQLQLSEAEDYALPLRLRVPDAASFLIETKQFGRDEAIGTLNALSLRWLAQAPAGRLSFSFFDPVGLGESFAGLMHLSDYEEILINSRIRTQEDQIDQRLGELCDHMEKVIQMYLRSDYETITQYNEAAGTIAERYHFVVVADFPKGFTEQAARRLLSIAASGSRCGVFLLLHCDQRADLPAGFQMDDLRKACLCVRSNIDGFFLKDNPVSGSQLTLDAPPEPDEFARWVHRIGEANRDSNRIEVPFSFITPDEDQVWSGGTTKEITVPIGRSGATKLQQLALGRGTCQHALIAGKTGSGKSTLFHVMVTNLALWCDPDEVEFYLIDFKKGVEFKCYADHQLPHARVIAIESDREFGLSVLQRIDEELKRRGELFRAVGVQDVAGYRGTNDAQPMPRTLLLIDEFQEFFTVDDQISQQAAVLLDRIVRQGRAFGIHAVLGSQTLGGAFTLARATLGQMTVRIALACNEADAYLIMDDSNPAPRLLTRPGEGIYNDRAGAAEANSPFQVVWLDEGERDECLRKVRDRAVSEGKDGGSLVVFEGNAPGDVTTDTAVSHFLDLPEFPGPARIFLGAPNAIKGPTEIRFERQSGSNLLFVGQRDDAIDSMAVIGLRLLREQLGDSARLVLIDGRFAHGEDTSPFCEAVRAIGGIETPNAHEMGPVINELAASMKARADGDTGGADSAFLVIPSLHRYKLLRYEEDFSFSMDEEAEAKPSTSLNELINEGPGWGFHVIVSVDSYNNVNRCLGRRAAGEFEKKILFQMSAGDSASLIESGAASDLGLNRALNYDEPTGTTEIFRPYSFPPISWFSE